MAKEIITLRGILKKLDKVLRDNWKNDILFKNKVFYETVEEIIQDLKQLEKRIIDIKVNQPISGERVKGIKWMANKILGEE